ncbi:MAG: (2Fe-2S) ferredoxin domain-containing protein [Rhodospirillales bacterium]
MTEPTATSPTFTSVLICINRRFHGDQPSCAQRGAEALADAIEAGVAARKINIRVERIKCLGQCMKGPTVRFSPGGRFNLHTRLDDVSGLLDEMERECGFRDEDTGPPLHLLGS